MKIIFYTIRFILVSAGFLLHAQQVFSQDGQLDPTFNGTGQETTEFTDGVTVFPAVGDSVLIEPPSNQILVAGTMDGSTTGSQPFSIAMARYNPDGSLDLNFIGDGSTQAGTSVFAFGAGQPTPLTTPPCYGGQGIQSKSTVGLQSDGKIVVACSVLNTTNRHNIFGVARFNSADGSLDTTFNAPNGFVIGPFGGNGSTTNISNCFGMAIQADDSIVCVGALRVGGSATTALMLLERFTANGVLDTAGFNPGGTGGDQPGTRTFGVGCSVGRAVAIRPSDQTIIVTGSESSGAFTPLFVAIFSTAGNLITNNSLQVIPNVTVDEGFAIALQSDEKIVVAGRSTNAGVTQFLVARFTANPSVALDPSFGGGNGYVLTSFNGIDDEARGVAIQADGKIVAAGFTTTLTDTEFAMARYLPDGTLDPSFGVGGKVTTPFSGPSGANAIAIQPDGKQVLAGFATIDGGNDFAVARYTSIASPTPIPGCIGIIDLLTQAIQQKYGS